MSYGIQVWDASGNLKFDSSDRMARVVQVGELTGSGSTTVSVPGMTNDGSWFVIAVMNTEFGGAALTSINNGSFTVGRPSSYYVIKS